MSEAKRDQNFVTTALGVSSVDGVTPLNFTINPITGRLRTDVAGGGSGTVTSVSVVTANGFAGTVATDTTTPAITLSTTITGVLYGNGTAISALTIGTGLSLIGTTLSATGTPAGSDTQVQYNDSGAFGGDSNFTWSTGDAELTVGATGAHVQIIGQLGMRSFGDDGTNGLSTSLVGADAVAGAGNGGAVILKGGLKAGGGLDGRVTVTNPTSSFAAVLNVDLIATSNKTFTFPNASGTIALTSDITSGANTALSNLASVAINTTLLPGLNDGAALGSATVSFSDLFLASGGVINWSNGDVTITHSTNTLAFAGASSGYTFDSLNTITIANTANTTGFVVNQNDTTNNKTAIITNNPGTGTDVQIVNSNAGTGSATLELFHDSASPAAEDGVGAINFYGRDSATNKQQYGAIRSVLTDPTSTSEDGSFLIQTVTGGTFATAVEINGTGIFPGANDAIPLGGATIAFSDLFLAEGGVINWDNGDATLTQAGNVVTLAGADLTVPNITIGAAGNVILSENASVALDPAGSADGKYTGITVTAVSDYTQAFGDLVYLKASNSRWAAADADAATTAGPVALAMVVVAGTSGNACTLLLQGIIRADAKFPTMTIGATQFVGETAGEIQGAIPTGADNIIRTVGYALTADELYFAPSTDWQVTVA